MALDSYYSISKSTRYYNYKLRQHNAWKGQKTLPDKALVEKVLWKTDSSIFQNYTVLLRSHDFRSQNKISRKIKSKLSNRGGCSKLIFKTSKTCPAWGMRPNIYTRFQYAVSSQTKLNFNPHHTPLTSSLTSMQSTASPLSQQSLFSISACNTIYNIFTCLSCSERKHK